MTGDWFSYHLKLIFLITIGGYGVDFSNDIATVEEGVRKVSKGLLTHGVTSFCPTLVTSPPETYHTVLPKIPKSPGGHHGATILGCHVEGPFINSSKKGAHPQECIKEFENVCSFPYTYITRSRNSIFHSTCLLLLSRASKRCWTCMVHSITFALLRSLPRRKALRK